MWPGYGLRKVPKTDSYEFGFLPPRLFNQVRDAFVAQRRSFATVDLAEGKVRAVAAARMDSRHDHLNALLDPK